MLGSRGWGRGRRVNFWGRGRRINCERCEGEREEVCVCWGGGGGAGRGTVGSKSKIMGNKGKTVGIGGRIRLFRLIEIFIFL